MLRTFPIVHRSLLLPLVTFCFATVVVDGQYHERALERAREVKMLTHDREAVRKIFYDFALDSSDETSDEFSLGGTYVKVLYSSGSCSEIEEEEEVWDVPAGLVSKIGVADDHLKVGDLRLDLSVFRRESMIAESKSQIIYHSKKGGLAVETYEDDVEAVLLFPSVGSKAKRCKSAFAKEFLEHESWFGKSGPPEGKGCVHITASVTQLELSHVEISASTDKRIGVTTTAVDPENDPLVYVYIVSGGKIIGEGAKVVWDLSGMASGKYTITAGVDDGCGLCGATVTKTVVVK